LIHYSKLLSISGLLKSNSLVLPIISNTRGEKQKSQRLYVIELMKT